MHFILQIFLCIDIDSFVPLGDRVVEMNSVTLDGYTRQQATELLKNSPPKATFILERYKQNRANLVSLLCLVMTFPQNDF